MDSSNGPPTACPVQQIVPREASDGVTLAATSCPAIRTTGPESVPALVHSAGPAAQFAWEEFIYAQIRNLNAGFARTPEVVTALRAVD